MSQVCNKGVSPKEWMWAGRSLWEFVGAELATVIVCMRFPD